MAKRKRLTPARIADARPETPPVMSPQPSTDARPPLASPGRAPIAAVAQDAATAAALTAVTHEIESARREGRLIQRLPLNRIEPNYIRRDRMAVDREEMQMLKDSLLQKGQQTAIEVAPTGDDYRPYGLISGWRRYVALTDLAREGHDIDSVLAIVRQPKDAADAYEAMVAENEIRANLSFYERAHIVLSAVRVGAYDSEKQALAALFASAPRARRSKIRAFVSVARALEKNLTFPTAISEKLGLRLAAVVEEDEDFVAYLQTRLTRQRPETAADEIWLLTQCLDERPALLESLADGPAEPPQAFRPAPPARDPGALRARAATAPERMFADVALRVLAPGRVLLEGRALTDPAKLEKVRAALRALE